MKIISISNSLTRPSDTTAYTSGDLIANSTTANSVTPLSFFIPYGPGFRLERVEIARSATSVTNASFRVHLYKDSPTVANGDNGAISSTKAGYQGFVDVVGTGTAFSDGASAYGVYINNSVYAPMLMLADVDRKLYALLEARGAYTPSSGEVFTVTLIGESYV